MVFSIGLLAAGLLILIKSADVLVEGAVAIAARLGLSALVIGLTVVAFGTSMPELVVTLVAGSQGNPDLAIANVVGSNIANVLLVLGIAAMIRPLPVQDQTVVSEIPFSLTAALLVGFLANAALFSDFPELSISRLDGGILLFFFLLFMLYVYKTSRNAGSAAADQVPEVLPGPGRTLIYVTGGIAGLYVGGELVVGGAVAFAEAVGIDDVVIGLTIVAIGTSTPELVASSVAAYRGQTDIAVGNVVGSNIFNLLWILGITSTVVELPFSTITNTDLVMVILSSSLILLSVVLSRTNTILRSHGGVFVCCYLAYVVFVVLRT